MPKAPRAFLNASVILAGLYSPSGASARILTLIKSGEINGCISEVVLQEALRHANKVKMTANEVEKAIMKYKIEIRPAPQKLVKRYEKISIDPGDIHLFTSAQNENCQYLVSLDKKHVLALVSLVKEFRIVSPGELLKKL